MSEQFPQPQSYRLAYRQWLSCLGADDRCCAQNFGDWLAEQPSPLRENVLAALGLAPADAAVGQLAPEIQRRADEARAWLDALPEEARAAAGAIILGVGNPDEVRDVGPATLLRRHRGKSREESMKQVAGDAPIPGDDPTPPEPEISDELAAAGEVLERVLEFVCGVPLDQWRAGLANTARTPGENALQQVGLRTLVAANALRPAVTGGMTDAEIGSLNGTTRANVSKFKATFLDQMALVKVVHSMSQRVREKCSARRLASAGLTTGEGNSLREALRPARWVNPLTGWAMHVNRLGGVEALTPRERNLLRTQTKSAFEMLRNIHSEV